MRPTSQKSNINRFRYCSCPKKLQLYGRCRGNLKSQPPFNWWFGGLVFCQSQKNPGFKCYSKSKPPNMGHPQLGTLLSPAGLQAFANHPLSGQHLAKEIAILFEGRVDVKSHVQLTKVPSDVVPKANRGQLLLWVPLF